MKKFVLLFSAFISFSPCFAQQESDNHGKQAQGSNAEYTELVRKNGATFHQNFSAGAFEQNGLLVTEDIYVNSNNTILVGRDNFVTRIKRYDGPFPGLQLKDRIVIVEDNIAAVHYLLQGEQNGKYGDLAPTGNKVEAMSAEYFVMDENGLMKDLLTITQLDHLKAQIKGEETIENHQEVVLYPIDHTVPQEVTENVTDLYLRHFNFRDWDALKSLLAEDVEVNWNGKMMEGADALMEAIKGRVSSFSNLTYQLDRSVQEGNRSSIAYTMNGTHDGVYTYKGKTYEPTQNDLRIREAQYLEVSKNGKIQAVIVVSNQDEFLNYIK